MKVDTLPIGLYQENSYVLHDHGHVLLIDPGRYAKQILSFIDQKEVVDGILLTHGHSDHTGAVDDLVDELNVPVYIHMDDQPLVDPRFTRTAGAEQAVYSALSALEAGEMKVGTFNVTIIHTPGHSLGSVLIRYRNLLFTGDTLFAGDIGRTDLYGGNDEQMRDSLELIKSLPNDLKVLPGHGPASTIGNEKAVNPYLRGWY